MQQQTIDESILQQLRRILSFQSLSRNYFLLRKFDLSIGCIRLQSLAKEKSFRQLLDYPNGIETLVNILIQYNYSNWIFDQDFNVIRPIFRKERKQVQILIKKNQVDEFKKFLLELDLEKECEVLEAEYIANKDFTKLFIVFDNEDEAQRGFSKIQSCKATFAIQNAKMEEVDFYNRFLNIVQSKQQQFQDQRMNNPRNYEDMQMEHQQFSHHHQSQQNQYLQYQQQKFYQQQQQECSTSDIVNQRLNQIRSNEKIELNYAPVQEQQSMFSFVPNLNPQQYGSMQEGYENPNFGENRKTIEIIRIEVDSENTQSQNAEQFESQTNQRQISRETESNKENSVERNNKKTHQVELYEEKQHFKHGHQQNGYGRNNYEYNKYHNKQNNRKQPYYNRLENDLSEFTGYKKYQQRQQKEYYEVKKEY
ncbi:unnamed protein product (macronuclear) [Paramecium tetraurelia]|uniref:HTH La-type RNA-binding domain-containing protein n=1 Tax=Paramecium tetraurelia TaxID=5888 RepID=A0EE93_PARTE|nr:uncharacterized protein GSPATT00025955001 [Paramecium tetraurelia]CAK93610.1 unnamed protein product [Paramecium tetraurelia]|eukprot:XP_001461007.1 hypothetical protein (macronuclear) [Paramecium tetraurelia strain d4-2]